MKHFMVLYMMPVEGLEGWMAKPEEERKAAEDKMKVDWDAWLSSHTDAVLNTVALGKAKRIDASGVLDAPNGMMLSSYVQAESAEEAAQIFVGHPHLDIPGATIEVMETSDLPK